MPDTLIKVDHLKKYYSGKSHSRGRYSVKAVDDVSFEIAKGEFLGVVGESGCGKSTLGRCVIRLEEVSDGKIIFDGTDITSMKYREIQPYRCRMQMVFQNPFSSFNPRKTIRSSLMEVGNYYKRNPDRTARRIEILLQMVNLDESTLLRRPGELSGGQLQRLAIVRALILNPDFIMADEPTSALDVSVQAQVLNIIMDLRQKENLTMLFISHELTVVEHICDRVMVMYLGSVVEMGNTQDVILNPKHPYTQALLSSKPREDPDIEKHRILLKGDVPNAVDVPEGCKFWTRCPKADKCPHTKIPAMKMVSEGHWVACNLVQ